MAAGNALGLYRRLARYMFPYWRQLSVIFLLSMLSPPLALLTPLPLKIAVDNVIGARPLPHILTVLLPENFQHSETGLLAFAVALIIFVGVMGQLRDFAMEMLSTYTGEKMLREFRARMFHHVQRLSLAYHDTKGTSDSAYRIQYDATGLQSITVDGIIPFATSVLTLTSMIYVTARINLQLAVVALAVSPAVFVVSKVYRRRLRREAHEVRKLESSAFSVVHEALNAARVVKAFGQEDHEERRFVRRSIDGLQARIRLALVDGSYGLVVALLSAIGTAAVLFIGVRDIRSGSLTLGELLLVMGYLVQLYSPLKTISKKSATMQTHLAGVERAFALLDELPDVVERRSARPIARAHGRIAFRNVMFAYENLRPILQGVSFEIPPGTALGIVGATGAGKTTLINLLTRFYDPTDGQIALDGTDLRDYKVADLRSQFAMVIQEPLLFSTSVAENIAYGRPEANDDEIIAAAKAAKAHEFICRLPHGYQTLVGERGMCLSGGERQRMSIARAYLRNAPILILDEPTSSVDVETEQSIVDALERLKDGRTSITIAHRRTALRHCTVILTLDGGRIVSIAPASTCIPQPVQTTDVRVHG